MSHSPPTLEGIPLNSADLQTPPVSLRVHLMKGCFRQRWTNPRPRQATDRALAVPWSSKPERLMLTGDLTPTFAGVASNLLLHIPSLSRGERNGAGVHVFASFD